MALSEDALVTLADLRKQGGTDLDDATLESLIEVASFEVVAYLKRPILYAEATDMPDLDVTPNSRVRQSWGTQNLWLRRYPVHDVTSVHVNGAAQEVATVTPADLPISSQGEKVWRPPEWDVAGKLVRFNGWPYGAVSVVYAGGYKGPNQVDIPEGVAELPPDIAQAVILTTFKIASVPMRDGELDLLMERTVGGWEQRWSSGFNSRADLIPSAAKMLIRKYRRRWFS